MQIRWMAVLNGFIVDLMVTTISLLVFYPRAFSSTDPTIADDPIVIGLGLLCTAIGGYVAGRLAGIQRWLNGFMVGVVGILSVQIQLLASANATLTRTQVFALALGCVAGAVGGWLSNLPKRPADLL
jgi:putative membrane protein (TIGR04086 family)